MVVVVLGPGVVLGNRLGGTVKREQAFTSTVVPQSPKTCQAAPTTSLTSKLYFSCLGGNSYFRPI